MLIKYFQQWALAFKSKSELSLFVEVYNELKASGKSSGCLAFSALTSV